VTVVRDERKMNPMKLISFALVPAIAVCLLENSAMAAARFVEAPSTVCAGSALAVSFQLAGLGSRIQVDMTTSAEAEFACVRPGNPVPPGEVQRMTTVASFPVERDGTASGVMILRPEIICSSPARQVVTYRGLTLEAGRMEAVAVAPGPIVCR
jgi:hypothetical protein